MFENFMKSQGKKVVMKVMVAILPFLIPIIIIALITFSTLSLLESIITAVWDTFERILGTYEPRTAVEIYEQAYNLVSNEQYGHGELVFPYVLAYGSTRLLTLDEKNNTAMTRMDDAKTKLLNQEVNSFEDFFVGNYLDYLDIYKQSKCAFSIAFDGIFRPYYLCHIKYTSHSGTSTSSKNEFKDYTIESKNHPYSFNENLSIYYRTDYGPSTKIDNNTYTAPYTDTIEYQQGYWNFDLDPNKTVLHSYDTLDPNKRKVIWKLNIRYPFPKPLNSSQEMNNFGDERTYGGYRGHEGIDLMAAKGTAILNIENGTVISAGCEDTAGYYIIIRSSNGNRQYSYVHLQSPALFSAGQQVEKGAVIGYVGDTGYGLNPDGTPQTGNFAPHLHLKIMARSVEIDENGNISVSNDFYPIDPYPLIMLSKKVTKF